MNFEKVEFYQEPNLQFIIRSLQSCSEPEVVVENVKKGLDFLILYPIKDAEDLFKYIMPSMVQLMKQIYNKNSILTQSGDTTVLEDIRKNLQVALMLTNCCTELIDYILKHGTVSSTVVPSVPVNLAQILLLTFEHCKSSQKIYQSTFKSVSEILELFRKTQEVHSKFLNLLDTCIVFQFLDEPEVMIFKTLLDVILQISEMLSGVNIKSMADNWKGYISLVQKYSKNVNTQTFILSSAVRRLVEEIEINMQNIFQAEQDLKKSWQTLKVNGFLIKVVLKLFEVELNITENFNDILNFCFVVYNWHPGFFTANNFPEEFVKNINTLLFENTETFLLQLFQEEEFIHKFCTLNVNDLLLSKYNFGFLVFSNEFLKNVSMMENPEVSKICIISLLELIFSCTRKCYKEFFYDYNSFIYEELVTNICITVLLFPESYPQVEKILLESIIQEKMWTAIMAIDIWCLVLKHSSVAVSCSTLNNLLTKIQELNFGIFIQTPAVIHLKIFTQRIFKTLPNHIMNEEISKYNPSQDKSVWKILSLQDIPLSQRFYIEFILSEMYDKVHEIEKENCSINEVMVLTEWMDVISYVAFNDLEINTARLISLISRLWSFNVVEVSLTNQFSKYFINKLLKLTVVLSNELSGENLTLVFSQLRQLLDDLLFKLLACDIIQGISRRNFNNFSEKLTLLSLITDVFQTLLTDRNPVIVAIALETFRQVSENDAYNTVISKLITQPDVKGLIANFMNENLITYSRKCFDKISDSKFQHRCIEWTDSDLPQSKKFKVDDNIDEMICNLKNNAEDLTRSFSRNNLNPRQVANLKSVINKLETLLM